MSLGALLVAQQLRSARQDGNWFRQHGIARNDRLVPFPSGMAAGALITVATFAAADGDLALQEATMAALNEARFLYGEYLDVSRETR